jgi:hypothetical protein
MFDVVFIQSPPQLVPGAAQVPPLPPVPGSSAEQFESFFWHEPHPVPLLLHFCEAAHPSIKSQVRLTLGVHSDPVPVQVPVAHFLPAAQFVPLITPEQLAELETQVPPSALQLITPPTTATSEFEVLYPL